MTDYTITTDFGAKDDLLSGNAAKIIKGSEFTIEFTNILTAVNSKADTVSPTFTGNTALNGTTTFGPDGTSTFNGTVNFTKDVTFDTNTMFVDVSENRVGIGTTSPDKDLHITATTYGPTIRLERNQSEIPEGGIIGAIEFESRDASTGSSGVVGKIDVQAKDTSPDTRMAFYTHKNNSGTGSLEERMRIDSSGNVGIGTTNPASLLHLKSSSAPTLKIDDSDSTYALELAQNGVNGSVLLKSAGELTIGVDHNSAASVVAFQTQSDERMRIDASGKVGIGTDSPSYPLHVKGADASILIQDSTTGFADQVSGVIFTCSGADGTPRTDIQRKVRLNGDALTFTRGPSDTEHLRIDSSGNVGIGTTNITDKLTVNGGIKAIQSDSVNTSAIALDFGSNIARVRSTVNGTGTQRPLGFFIGGSEKARIDSSGNLLVGTTSTNPQSRASGEGVQLSPDFIGVGRYRNPALYLNRQDNDGTIAEFRKDGSTVGSIGTITNRLHIGSGNTFITFYNDGNSIYPAQSNGTLRDDAIDIGSSSGRFDDIYATNGTIQTSDRNEKQGIRELLDAEQRVAVAAKGLLRAFKWNSAVEEKGDEARIHFGIIAQDLQDAFTAEGLDAGDYAMFINSTWTDEETGEERSRMGVRYSELLAFIISAI